MASGSKCRDQKSGFPQKLIGLILILVGALLLILFVPFETWLAVIGLALIIGGLILRMM